MMENVNILIILGLLGISFFVFAFFFWQSGVLAFISLNRFEMDRKVGSSFPFAIFM